MKRIFRPFTGDLLGQKDDVQHVAERTNAGIFRRGDVDLTKISIGDNFIEKREARDLVPGFLLNKAGIVEVDAFTPEVIKSLQTKAA